LRVIGMLQQLTLNRRWNDVSRGPNGLLPTLIALTLTDSRAPAHPPAIPTHPLDIPRIPPRGV
jgi:hypothetical protein